MVGDHLGADRDVSIEHLELRRAFRQLATACADGLVAGQDHRVSRVRQEIQEVVHNPAAGRHAGRGVAAVVQVRVGLRHQETSVWQPWRSPHSRGR